MESTLRIKKMRKIILWIFIIIFTFSTWIFLNSEWFITTTAEQKLKPILAHGTKRQEVVNHLISIGLRANQTTGRHKDGTCARAHSGSFNWNCDHSSYIQTGWHAGFLGLLKPHIEFFFNETDQLVNYYASFSYTFI